jgi:hypothetical protein
MIITKFCILHVPMTVLFFGLNQGGFYSSTLQGTSTDGYEMVVRMLLDREAKRGMYGKALQGASYGSDVNLERTITSPEAQEQYRAVRSLPTKNHGLDRLNELETIDARLLPPWRAEPFAEIEIEADRETQGNGPRLCGPRLTLPCTRMPQVDRAT